MLNRTQSQLNLANHYFVLLKFNADLVVDCCNSYGDPSVKNSFSQQLNNFQWWKHDTSISAYATSSLTWLIRWNRYQDSGITPRTRISQAR